MAIPEIFNYTKDRLADNATIPDEKIATASDVVEGETQGFYQPPPEKVDDVDPFSREDDLIAAWGQLGKRPEPEYDENREKRLQTIAGASGVAKALSLLGDAFAVSKDAPIIGRRIETDDPNVRQIMQDRKEHKGKLEASEQQAYLDSIRRASGLSAARAADYEHGLARADRAEAMDTAERRRAEDLARDAAKDKESARRFDVTQTQAAEDRKTTAKYRQDALQLQRDKALWDNLYKQQTAGGKTFTLVTPDGKTQIPVRDAGQLQAIYSAIINDKDPGLQADAMDRLKFMRSKMEGMNTNDLRNFVQEFWHRSGAAQELIKGLGAGSTLPPAPAGVPAHIANPASAAGVPATTRGGVPMARPKEQEGDEVKVTQTTTTTPEGGAKETTTVQIDPNALQQAVQAKDADKVGEMLRSGGATPEQIDAFMKKYDVLKAEGAKQDTQPQTESQKKFAGKKDLKASDVGDVIRELAELGGMQTKDEKGRDTEEYKQFFKENYEAVNNDYQAEVAKREGAEDEAKASKRKKAYDKYGTLKTP